MYDNEKENGEGNITEFLGVNCSGGGRKNNLEKKTILKS
jgi:hypothetical protein